MNNKNIYIIFIITCFLSNCKPEPETRFELVYVNETNSSIVLLNSYGHPESYFTDTLLQIAPNTKKNISSQQEGVDGIDEFPHNLIFQLIPGDSITVIFDDSISVLHYPESITNAYIELLDTNGLLYSESRNLYHSSSYFREKVGDDYFRGTYTFTQEDVDYAIEINE